MQKITVVTHNSTFHSDELLAIALIAVANNINTSDLDVIRTRDADVINKAISDNAYIVDVGGVYHPPRQFDHHQFDKDNTLYGKSSAGLVYDYLKPNDIKFNDIDTLVKETDIRDTRVGGDAKNLKYINLFNAITDANNIDIYSIRQKLIFKRILKELYNLLTTGNTKYIDKIIEFGNHQASLKEKKMSIRFRNLEVVGTIQGISVYKTPKMEYVNTQLFDDKPYILLYWDNYQNMTMITCNTNYCKLIGCNNKNFIHTNGFIGGSKMKSNYVEDYGIQIELV